MTPLSLDRLLAPVDPASFLARTWGREPRLFPGALATDAAGVLDLAGLERLLATGHRLADGWLHLADGGKRPLPREMVDDDGMVDLTRLWAAVAGGASLYLAKAERLWPPLGGLCRQVHADLAALGVTTRRPVNAHVFLTPPGARAFVAHRDEHASLVLQLDGTKEWLVYDTPRSGSTPGATDPADLAGRAPACFRLERGDVLYLPEWWTHEARTTDGHSLHVTLRVFPLRWSDLLRDLADGDPDLAQAVPAGLADEPGRLAAALSERLDRPASVQRAPGLLGAAVERRRSWPVPLPGAGLQQAVAAARIDPDTVLERCAGVPCDVVADGDEVALRFPGGALRGPAALRDVFALVASVERLRPADLPDVAAGPYDRVGVAQRLIECGVLRRSRPRTGSGGPRVEEAGVGW